VPLLYPLSTVRCDGSALFRDQRARETACILDADDDIESWSCRLFALTQDGQTRRPDFHLHRTKCCLLVDAARKEATSVWASEQADTERLRYEFVEPSELPPIRLKNAKELLRYARCETPLPDRGRLLAALDECSTLTVAEALLLFREPKPMAGLALMVLVGLKTMDVDESLIGPETIVRHQRD
jgi:hypothetical protein